MQIGFKSRLRKIGACLDVGPSDWTPSDALIADGKTRSKIVKSATIVVFSGRGAGTSTIMHAPIERANAGAEARGHQSQADRDPQSMQRARLPRYARAGGPPAVANQKRGVISIAPVPTATDDCARPQACDTL